MTVRRLLSALLVALTGLALTVITSDPAAAAGTGSLRLRDGDRVCAGVTNWIAGSGFIPGHAYDLTSSWGSLMAAPGNYGPVTAGSDGTLEAAMDVPSYAAQTKNAMVWATSRVDGIAAGTLPLPQAVSTAVTVASSTPAALTVFPANSQLTLTGSCYQLGESLQISSPQLSLGPVGVTYRPDGDAAISAKVLAVPLTGTATVTVTGNASGRQAVAKVSTGGNVLNAGTQLEDPGGGQLVSASGSYRLLMEPGGFYLCHLPPTRPGSLCDRTWTMPFSHTSAQPMVTALQMQSNGNLAIHYSVDPGGWTWSTGTGGIGNRLVLRDDGTLAVTSARGDLQWTSKLGLLRGPAGYLTIPYIAGSRAGLYVNGLIKRWNGAGQLARCAHCLVYLQRYLNGGWQYVVARTTDGAGQVAVGFIQTTVYRYRWKVAYAPDLTGSISTGIDR
jgi:hypothetical protein